MKAVMIPLFYLLFIGSSGLIVLLLFYPLVSYLRSRIRPDPVRKNTAFQPPVSILIACYNEERYLEERLNALLSESEWIPGSELLIVSTGSTDRTNAILETYRHRPEVQVFIEERMTKITALNLAVQHAQHDYFVFSDCRQLMKPGSIRHLVANLIDPRVGTVTCTLMDTSERPSFFRRLYLFLARCDSKTSSTFNLYGALYVQRKEVFRPIPDHLLFDDFFVAVSTLAQGKRLIQEEHAVLYDVPFPDYYNRERIERLARGLLIFLFNNFGLLRQIKRTTRWRLLVYKYLKLILPLLAFCALLSGGLLFGRILLNQWVGIALLALAGTVLLYPALRRNAALLLRIQYYFMTALFGYFALNRRSKHWEPLSVKRKWFFMRTK